jgi:hypothetical protein
MTNLFAVVQDRALLYENIGATKELGAEMHSNKANITAMQTRSQGVLALHFFVGLGFGFSL